MNTPSFAVVHNIPSPYRLHLFTVLWEALRDRGVALTVHFMARGHADRLHWSDAALDVPFPHVFWRDVGPRIRGKEWHLNPGIIARLWRDRPDYLLVGGPWDSLTTPVVTMLNRAGTTIGWFEGNTRTPGRVRGIARTVKKALLDRCSFVAVPGSEGARLAELILGDEGPPTTILPNVVDEARFRGPPADRESVRRRYGVRDGETLVVWPARLIPAKGIGPFLGAITAEDLGSLRIAILGEGPLKPRLDELIVARGLQDRVRIHAPCAYGAMPALYGAADLFLLPSMDDPNPLSVVEAMHSGLPILVSNRIGNLPEALRDGKNGWVVDPERPDTIRAALREVRERTPAELRAMGELSRRFAAEFWASRPAVERFLDAVMAR